MFTGCPTGNTCWAQPAASPGEMLEGFSGKLAESAAEGEWFIFFYASIYDWFTTAALSFMRRGKKGDSSIHLTAELWSRRLLLTPLSLAKPRVKL